MNKYYPNLFLPIRLRGHVLRNRLLAAPLWVDNSFPLGTELAREYLDYYEERAKGGFAMVSPGDFPVNHDFAGYEQTGRFHFYEDAPGMRASQAMQELVRRIHRHGALAEAELIHLGCRSGTAPLGYVVGPTGFIRPDGVAVIEMTEEMIEQTCDDFAKCAVRAKEFGFDAVLIHGGHGWLITQFLSPRDNRRTDPFGGSVENRARFPKMLLERVRKAVGDDMIIELRISAVEDMQAYAAYLRKTGNAPFQTYDEPGITIEQSVEFCKMIDGIPDIVHISAGNHTDRTFAPIYFPNGVNVPEAEAVKKALKKSLVTVVGGINDPDFAEELIASGKVDFVSMARQSIADPYFPRKAQEGFGHEINSCIRCGYCHSCSVNPVHNSYEHDIYARVTPAEVGRRVVVVGGGPGGLKAAETAAKRGHEVVLFEKEAVLGGKLRFAGGARLKTDVDRFLKNLIKRVVLNSNIDIRLNAEATPEAVNAEKPYAVIAAVGADFNIPVLPGASDVEAFNVVDAFLNFDKLGERIVIVGGGTSGCDAAAEFASKGKKVTVLSRNREICKGLADGMGGSQKDLMLKQLEKYGVQLYRGCVCTGFQPGGVRARDTASGADTVIGADCVVYATGEKKNQELAESFRGDFPFFRSIGDCVKVGLIGDAIYSGYYAAFDI